MFVQPTLIAQPMLVESFQTTCAQRARGFEGYPQFVRTHGVGSDSFNVQKNSISIALGRKTKSASELHISYNLKHTSRDEKSLGHAA